MYLIVVTNLRLRSLNRKPKPIVFGRIFVLFETGRPISLSARMHCSYSVQRPWHKWCGGGSPLQGGNTAALTLTEKSLQLKLSLHFLFFFFCNRIKRTEKYFADKAAKTTSAHPRRCCCNNNGTLQVPGKSIELVSLPPQVPLAPLHNSPVHNFCGLVSLGWQVG